MKRKTSSVHWPFYVLAPFGEGVAYYCGKHDIDPGLPLDNLK